MVALLQTCSSPKDLFDNYISSNAKYQINVSSRTFNEIKDSMRRPNHNTFDAAILEVVQLMSNDVFPR